VSWFIFCLDDKLRKTAPYTFPISSRCLQLSSHQSLPIFFYIFLQILHPVVRIRALASDISCLGTDNTICHCVFDLSAWTRCLFVLFQYCTIDDVIALTNHLVVLRCENTLASGAARSSNASMNAAMYWGLGMLLSITLNRLMNLGPPVDQDWSSQQVQCTARKEWCSVLLTTNAVQFRQQYERSVAIFSRVSRPFTALHYG
jgi:hypothetical protein